MWPFSASGGLTRVKICSASNGTGLFLTHSPWTLPIDDGLFVAARCQENKNNKRFSEMHFVAQATSTVFVQLQKLTGFYPSTKQKAEKTKLSLSCTKGPLSFFLFSPQETRAAAISLTPTLHPQLKVEGLGVLLKCKRGFEDFSTFGTFLTVCHCYGVQIGFVFQHPYLCHKRFSAQITKNYPEWFCMICWGRLKV